MKKRICKNCAYFSNYDHYCLLKGGEVAKEGKCSRFADEDEVLV